MDYKTKRRLVVAIIIIALAVIFLPAWFGSRKQPVATSFKEVPNQPAVQKPDAIKNQAPETIAKNFQAQGPVLPESPLNNKVPATPEVQSKPAPAAAAAQLKIPVPAKAVAPTQAKPVKPIKKLAETQDQTPVVDDFSGTGGSDSVQIHEDALAHLPNISVRKNDATSENVVDYHQREKLAKAQNHAFVIQLASFNSPVPGRQLVAKLREAGYVAFMQTAEIHSKQKHRVYVGPFTQLQQAEAMLHIIDKKLHMHGYVHDFKPTVMIP